MHITQFQQNIFIDQHKNYRRNMEGSKNFMLIVINRPNLLLNK